MQYGTWGLRSGRCFRVLRRAFSVARARFGMRLCHFSVMGNHIHFLVEADDSLALARGMKGLGVRIAKSLNRVMGKTGRVYADRYFSRILRTPTEVAKARNYVINNALKHKLIPHNPDPFSSQKIPDATVPPLTWLLSQGYLRAGPHAARTP